MHIHTDETKQIFKPEFKQKVSEWSVNTVQEMTHWVLTLYKVHWDACTKQALVNTCWSAYKSYIYCKMTSETDTHQLLTYSHTKAATL